MNVPTCVRRFTFRPCNQHAFERRDVPEERMDGHPEPEEASAAPGTFDVAHSSTFHAITSPTAHFGLATIPSSDEWP